jgi:predicted glycosyltransferase
MVVCRSGYSTVMDLIKLQKKALMIPTPGQTEQEYLGKRFKELNWFTIQDQQDLDLQDGIEKCLLSTNIIPALKFDMFCKAIERFSIQYFGA